MFLGYDLFKHFRILPLHWIALRRYDSEEQLQMQHKVGSWEPYSDHYIFSPVFMITY